MESCRRMDVGEQGCLNGLSVLPYFGGSYSQAPFQDITEEYNNRINSLKNVDLTNVIEIDDHVDLLDYKTGVHNVKYQQQLENYQEAIEKMGYKVVKKVLVYIGLAIDIVNLS